LENTQAKYLRLYQQYIEKFGDRTFNTVGVSADYIIAQMEQALETGTPFYNDADYSEDTVI
jgi:hypothetical protein